MYNPNTLDGEMKAMATEEPFMHYLNHCISLHDYTAPKNPRILDVGCCRCLGAKRIADFFDGTLVGIDITKKNIENAKKGNPEEGLEFVLGDAANIKEIAPGPYDIIIARNMPPGSDYADALKACRKEGSDSAVIFATFYAEFDFEMGKMHIEDAGFEIKEAGINPYYPSSVIESVFSAKSNLFGLFGTSAPTNPGFLKSISKFLGF